MIWQSQQNHGTTRSFHDEERLTPAQLGPYGWQIAAELRRIGLEREAEKLDERVKASGGNAR